MADVSGSQWRLVQVRPNAAHIAGRNLLRQGFEVFCPMRVATLRRDGRFISRETPLFPGYLFISHAAASAPWRVVNSTYGVSRLVGFGQSAAEVPPQLIVDLKARCDEQGRLAPPPGLKPGDAVIVQSGPFAQFVATVEAAAPQKRIWLLLDLLGRPTRIAVAAEDLALAS